MRKNIKNNKETTKMLIVSGIVGLFVILAVLLSAMGSKGSVEIAADFKTAFASSDNEMIYLGRPTCSYCQMLEPILKTMREEYDVKYTYINTDEISSTQLSEILKELGIKEDEFGTPYLVIVKDEEVIDRSIGLVDASVMFEFLQTNGLIASDAEAPRDLINYVDYDKYKEIIASEEEQLIFFGQTTCTFCLQAKPILNKIIKAEEIKINYLELDLLSEQNNKIFMSTMGEKLPEGWGTPIAVIVKNGEIIDVLNGLADEAGYLEFFKKNNIVK